MLRRLLLAALFLFAATAGRAASGDITVVYLGAYDCFYCQQWEARAKGELLESNEGKAVRFYEVMGRTLREPIVEQNFPDELKWLARKLGPSRGVPRFLLVIDGQVARSVYGTNDYEMVFLPALRQAVAARRPRT